MVLTDCMDFTSPQDVKWSRLLSLETRVGNRPVAANVDEDHTYVEEECEERTTLGEEK